VSTEKYNLALGNIERLTVEKSEFESKIQGLEGELSEARFELTNLQAAKGRLEKELEQTKHDLAASLNEQTRLKKEVAEISLKEQELQLTKFKLEGDLKLLTLRIKEIKTKAESLMRSIEEMERL
jgi:chromosome segregation ATPase